MNRRFSMTKSREAPTTTMKLTESMGEQIQEKKIMVVVHCHASSPYLRDPHHTAPHYLLRRAPRSPPIIYATSPQPLSSSSPSAASTRRTLLVSIATTSFSSLILSPPSKSAINTEFFDLPNSGGVKALDLRAGTGATPVDGDQVAIHYYGRLAAKQGWRFDSTYDHKDSTGEPIPFVFTLGSGKVISGIESAVRSMQVGGTRRVIIPPSQGYQNTSQEPIPPNFFDRQRLFTTIFNPTRLANGEGSTLGTLIFDIELISMRH